MKQEGNMAPGQQNYPVTNKEENNKNALSEKEIIEGARNEDQLDKMKEDATKGEGGTQHGAGPVDVSGK